MKVMDHESGDWFQRVQLEKSRKFLVCKEYGPFLLPFLFIHPRFLCIPSKSIKIKIIVILQSYYGSLLFFQEQFEFRFEQKFLNFIFEEGRERGSRSYSPHKCGQRDVVGMTQSQRLPFLTFSFREVEWEPFDIQKVTQIPTYGE